MVVVAAGMISRVYSVETTSCEMQLTPIVPLPSSGPALADDGACGPHALTRPEADQSSKLNLFLGVEATRGAALGSPVVVGVTEVLFENPGAARLASRLAAASRRVVTRRSTACLAELSAGVGAWRCSQTRNALGLIPACAANST